MIRELPNDLIRSILYKLDDETLFSAIMAKPFYIKPNDIFWLNRFQDRYDIELSDIRTQINNDNYGKYYFYICNKYGKMSPETLLIDGINDPNIMKVRMAIRMGADINCRQGYSIITASSNGNAAIVDLLIKHKVDIHVRDHSGPEAALRLAAVWGRLDVIKLLVDNGADIHTEDGCVLNFAAVNDHVETVRYLLDKGARPTDKTFRWLNNIYIEKPQKHIIINLLNSYSNI